jgi:hypothetical protein
MKKRGGAMSRSTTQLNRQRAARREPHASLALIQNLMRSNRTLCITRRETTAKPRKFSMTF